MVSPTGRSAKRELPLHADRIERAPEILVPPEERVALAQFVAGLSKRREVALALARPTPFEPQPETPPGGPLEIAKLEVPPLIPVTRNEFMHRNGRSKNAEMIFWRKDEKANVHNVRAGSFPGVSKLRSTAGAEY
jgi:hypothetical protein